MTGLQRLFVYGTLMRGQANARLLAGAPLVGPARTVAGYRLLLLQGYPALVPVRGVSGSTAVPGEIYLVGEAQLARLDEFEGHPTLFRRQDLALAGGGTAQAYLHANPQAVALAPLVPGGDWRRWQQRTPGEGR